MSLWRLAQTIPLPFKLGLIVAIPILALSVLAWGQVSEEKSAAGELSKLMQLSNLAVSTSAFVHESQKERGATALFQGSGGASEFQIRLSDQRAVTDEKLAELQAFLGDFDERAYGDAFLATFNKAKQFRDRMTSHRGAVDGLGLSGSEGLAPYTQMNAAHLDMIAHIGSLSNDAELGRFIAAYVNFLQGKERSGQERAVLSGAFAAGSFSGDFFNRFSQLVTEQETYQRVFESFATVEQRALYEQTVTGTPVTEVDRMRAIAAGGATSDDLGVDAGYWFDTMTAKINLVKQVEDQLSADLVARASELQSAANASFQRIAVISVMALILSIGLGIAVGQAISKPIGEVSDALEAVAGGKLDVEVHVSSNDKIGDMASAYQQMQAYLTETAAVATHVAEGDLRVAVTPKSADDVLGNAFGIMVTSLREVLGETASTADALATAKNELGRISEEAAKATQEVARAIGQVAEGSNEQATGVQKVNDGVIAQRTAVDEATTVGERVATAAQQMTDNAAAASEGAKEATATADEGVERVQLTVSGIVRIKETVDAASQEISTLGERSAEIGKIVSVIEDIAAQTNLLALNAAIEAARAGEQGRGFAVVADEVRQLAERVSSATKEIAELIQGVQAGVDNSVVAMEEGAREMDAGTQAAESAGEALQGILSAVQTVSRQIEQIADGAGELQSSASEMARRLTEIRDVTESNSEAVNSIATVAEENSAATEEVSASTEELSAQVEEISASTDELGQLADALSTQIGRFDLGTELSQSRALRVVEDEREDAQREEDAA